MDSSAVFHVKHEAMHIAADALLRGQQALYEQIEALAKDRSLELWATTAPGGAEILYRSLKTNLATFGDAIRAGMSAMGTNLGETSGLVRHVDIQGARIWAG